MLVSIKDLFTKNIGMKVLSFFLALTLWFYIVNELEKGTEEDVQFLHKLIPSGEMIAKKLTIKPVFVGTPKREYGVAAEKVVVVPQYCIVVGDNDILGKVKYAYTMPIDISGAHKSFTKEVPLNPIAPGIYTEETLVQVTVPVQKTIK